jgi:N-acetylglutamate synthase-like GNAT family acetyltransferase
MNALTHRVRRATVDDLPSLKAHWEMMRFAPADLEKRLTEFQVVEDAGGNVLGGLALQISNHHGCIHSEAYGDFALAEAARPLFLKRLESLATNHGLVRLWTQDSSPFWTHNGFQPADAETLAKLPEAWDRHATGWLTLQLRAEVAMKTLADSVDVDLLMKLDRERTQQALARVKLLNRVALVVAILLLIVVGGLVVYLLKRNPGAMEFFHR